VVEETPNRSRPWLITPWLVGLCFVTGAVALAFDQTRPLSTLLFGIASTLAVLSAVSAIAAIRNIESGRSVADQRARALESEVERNRDALDDLAEGLDVMIFLTDEQGRILYSNNRAADAFNFEDPVGKVILAVTMSTEIVELVEQVAASGVSQIAEVTFRHPEERVGIVQVWRESSDQNRLFVTIYDITELRRLERVRRDFVANVSHELRTPMTTIRAMAETLQDNDPNDADLRDKYLAKIIREVDRLTRITDDLLTLSIVESGRPAKVVCNATELVRGVVHQLSSKAQERGLHIQFTGEPNILVLANEPQLTQVAMNLIDNAINYSTEGDIVVSLHRESGAMVLTVTDQGIGIAQDHIYRVFERFYRVDKGRSRATGGTGLGLAIVRNIVEGHDGKIAVESALHHGSTFTVTWPLGDTDAGDEVVSGDPAESP